MSSIITCYMPAAGAPAKDRSAWARKRIAEALDAGVAPTSSLPVDAARMSISFDRVLLQRLTAMARLHGASPGQMAGRIVAGLEKAKAPASPDRNGERRSNQFIRELRKSRLDEMAVAPLRPEQIRLLTQTREGLVGGRAVFAEGGTGVGKSRVIATLAQESFLRQSKRAANERRPVIICAPTIATLTHLIEEWRQTTPGGQARVAATLGRGQFVNPQAIRDLLEADPDADEDDQEEPAARWPRAAAWLRAGMPAGRCPATRILQALHPGLVGLAADLQAVEPEFPVEQALMNADDDVDDEDEICWRALRDAAHEADVVFSTHAMVAADAMQRARRNALTLGGGAAEADADPSRTILPDRALLLIDEAHLYEDAQASVMSDGVSIFALRTALAALRRSTNGRHATLARQACEAADEALAALRQFDDDVSLPLDGTSRAQARIWAKAAPKLVALDAALADLLKTLDKAKAPGVRLRRARAQSWIASRALAAFIGRGKTVSSRNLRILLSPTRRFPTLVFGPKSVRPQLAALWASTESAGLFSATLYLPTQSNGLSARHMMFTLNVPQERAAFITPVHAPWSLSTPLVLTPNAAAARRLTPPSSKLEQVDFVRALDVWTTATARVVRGAAGSAAGGTLVLMTGFERARLLAAALQEDLGERLVEQTSSRSAGACKAAFIALRRRGLRPVWIGTGAAWTGLDLRDEEAVDPKQDLLLTDLMIPNVFNMIKSSTDLEREARYGFEAVRSKALFAFRQGIGRLMRRKGVEHRRLWILDARLARRAANTLQYRILIDAYPKHARFGLDGGEVKSP